MSSSVVNLPEKGKTARLSKEARRAQLLSVAASLFAESSFGGVTTSALAKAAGVSEPVLYQHFSNKDELYQEVLKDGCRKTLAQWRKIRSESNSAIESVRAIIAEQFASVSELWIYYKIHLRAISEASNPVVSEILNENNTRYHDYLRIAFQEAQINGELRSDIDTSDLAWLFVSQGLMLNYSRQIGLKGPQVSGYLERLMDQALGEAKRA